MEQLTTKIFLKSYDLWEEKANKVLSNFNYTHPEEIDMEEICWRYGIVVKPLEKLIHKSDIDENLKAHSVIKTNRRGIVYIRSDLTCTERKIILAEEFSHIYADATHQINSDNILINKSEYRAKRMAAYLLMPFHFLKQILNCAMEQAVLVDEIANHFLVSKEFAYYRLELLFNHRMDMIKSCNSQEETVQMF